MRHVIVMAGTGALGLVAVFVVDLFNFFYLSLLGETDIAAAVGFTGVVSFFQISLSIGLTIGIAAAVSRAIGADRFADARRMAAVGLLMVLVSTAIVGILTAIFIMPILSFFGASGTVRSLAARFLVIVSPSLPLMTMGMAFAAIQRSIGDAKGSLSVTFYAAIAAALLDPLFIFGFHLGFEGAAISNVLSRVVLFYVGYRGAVRRHDLVGRVQRAHLRADLLAIGAVAGPAILTNLATPIGAAFLTHAMATFGAYAVAAQASIDRMTPVAFGLIYALSGAVGPILAQNLGAGRLDRVRETLRDSLLFVSGAVGIAWLLLFSTSHLIAQSLSLSTETAVLVTFFCNVLAGTFLFTGLLFVANAAFNNLGFPLLSTLFNWGRATLGTVPLIWYGMSFGPQGAMTGAAMGSVVFGTAAIITAFSVVGRLAAPRTAPGQSDMEMPASAGFSALTRVLDAFHHSNSRNSNSRTKAPATETDE